MTTFQTHGARGACCRPLSQWLPRFAVAILAALAGFVSNEAWAQTQPTKSTLDTILERGVLLAGVRYDYPPNGYMDASGEVKGYGPDVAREFARRLGVQVKFVQETSQTRIPLLLNGQVDASFGPTTPSKSRDEVVDFSLVWNVEAAVVVVRSGSPLKPEDYYKSGKSIGAAQGAIFIELWKGNDADAKFKLFPDYNALMQALLAGHVEAALMNETQAKELAAQVGGNKVQVGQAFFRDPSAIMMRENDSRWRDWINWALQRLWSNGTLQKLYEKNYGMKPGFEIWQNGMLQPGVGGIAKERDPWKE